MAVRPQGAIGGRRYLLQLAAVVAAYYAAAHLGYALRFAGPVASMVWLPVGVGIAALYLLGPQLWPAVMIGDLLVNNYSTLPVGSAIGQSVGNVLEVVVAAMLLRHFRSRTALLGSLQGLAGVLVALLAGTALSATIGVLSLFLGDVLKSGSMPHVWRTWLLGDFSGALLVVPLVLAWYPLPRGPWFEDRMLEMTLLLTALVGVGLIAWASGPALSYLSLPLLTWAALRFGPRGAILTIVVGAGFTIWATTTHYAGPFALHPLARTVLDTQLYLALSTVATLTVAVLVRERERLMEDVHASRTRIVAAAEDERRRLERDIHDGAQQRLVALAAQLGLAATDARTEPRSAAASFEAAQTQLLLAIEELRELVHGIRPPVLRQFGLTRAIELAAGRCWIPVEVHELPDERLDDTAEATAYYVVLEALTNAQKYARASTVSVRARLAHGRLEVEIVDDGIGGAVERDELGLQGLRDRVEALGGGFAVRSGAGNGTRITARIPAQIAG